MRVDIWIRKANEDRWNAIEDKSAWLNEVLSTQPPLGAEPQATEKPAKNTPPKSKTCKKGHPLFGEKCLQKGCS